uniref:Uncharacterized protein n=1 Tax=Knipowitschia caucasica TaxID=637954 RepID=A0AAV2KJZ8_KNICA
MSIPPGSSTQTGMSKPPTRGNTIKVKPEAPAMDKVAAAKPKDDRTEPKDLRSNPPTKVKLPSMSRSPAVRDKPSSKLSPKTNGETPPASPKQVEDKDKDQFDAVDIATEKLSHPTANRAKPPQRRPPTNPGPGVQETESDKTEAGSTPTKPSELKKPTESTLASPAKPDQPSRSPPPARPAPPKVLLEGKASCAKDKPSVESLQVEVQELRAALELLQTQYKAI